MIRAFVFLLLATLLIVGAAWYMLQPGPDGDGQSDEAKSRVEEGFLTTKKDFNDKLEEFKRRKDEALVQIGRLDQRKEDAAKKLRELGIETAEDLENSPPAQLEYSHIRNLMKDAEKLESDVKVFDDAIRRIESALKDIERRQLMENVAIDDAKYKQMRTIINDVDDRLIKPDAGLEALETQSILDDLLNPKDGK